MSRSIIDIPGSVRSIDLMSHLTPAIILTVAALSIRWPPPVRMTNLSLSIPSKNFESPFT